jgi:hypothetical protein
MSNNANESAFPIFLQEGLSSNSHVEVGLTKREYFAAMIMQGYCANEAVVRFGVTPAEKAEAVIIQADELLKQLETKTP